MRPLRNKFVAPIPGHPFLLASYLLFVVVTEIFHSKLLMKQGLSYRSCTLVIIHMRTECF